jgi:hypothetical protein
MVKKLPRWEKTCPISEAEYMEHQLLHLQPYIRPFKATSSPFPLHMIEKSLVELDSVSLINTLLIHRLPLLVFKNLIQISSLRSLLGCLPYKKMQQGGAYQTDGAATSQWTYEGKYVKCHECNFQSLDKLTTNHESFHSFNLTVSSRYASITDIHHGQGSIWALES